ncbi:hypothetical protein M405DRAFT_802785 [Rhizopogon salebrosus TDB-379]|nr:hypothetical protein M405DRAFT_802785 [Rhizopogon salebrosus TDB-379]
MASVLVPVLYVGVVVSCLLFFSHFYRKRNAAKIYEPYFPSHPERDVYVSLLQKSDPPAHEALLKSALVRRAMTDVSRVLKLREDKPALQNLLQKGSIGDDIWNSLLQAEKELETEIMEVVAEANTFVEGWGGLIFQTAGEMIANEKIRNVYEATAASRAEKEQKYGKVGTKIDLPVLQPGLVNPIPPQGQGNPAMLAAAAAGRPSGPTPSIPAKPPNGLLQPQNTKTQSVASSDGEGQDTPTPSKSSKKKAKKRK